MKPIAIFLLIATCISSPAFADQEPAPDRTRGLVALDVDSCESGNVDLIRRIVQLELGDLLRTASSPADVATAVRAECRAGTVLLSVNDRITRKLLQRTIAVHDLADPNESRMIGLAIAELVTASWVELSLERTQADLTVPLPEAALVDIFVQKRVRPRQEALERRWQPGAFVRMSSHSTGLKMMGFGASLNRRWTDHVELAASMDHARGTQSSSAGVVHVQSTTAGASAAGRLQVDRLNFVAGLGLRMGTVVLRGQDETGGLVTAKNSSSPWAGAVTSLEFRVRAASWLLLQVGAEYGVVMLGVSARVLGHVQPQVEGRWLAAIAGASLVF